MSEDAEDVDVPLRYFEPLAVFCVWALVFMVFVGPIIGAALPGADKHALADRDPTDEERRGSDWTVRGVLMVLSGLPLVFGYGYLRPRLVGQTPVEFWSGPGDGPE